MPDGSSAGRALDVLGLVLGEDFQNLIDREIKGRPKTETDADLKLQEQRDSKAANGLTERQLRKRHDDEWTAFSTANPTKNNTRGYDKWVNNAFKPGYQTEVDGERGTHWLGRLIKSLFTIRLESVPRPAGL